MQFLENCQFIQLTAYSTMGKFEKKDGDSQNITTQVISDHLNEH